MAFGSGVVEKGGGLDWTPFINSGDLCGRLITSAGSSVGAFCSVVFFFHSLSLSSLLSA